MSLWFASLMNFLPVGDNESYSLKNFTPKLSEVFVIFFACVLCIQTKKIRLLFFCSIPLWISTLFCSSVYYKNDNTVSNSMHDYWMVFTFAEVLLKRQIVTVTCMHHPIPHAHMYMY